MNKNTSLLICGLIAACILLTSCVNEKFEKAFMKSLVPPADDSLARQLIESIRIGDYNKAKTEIDPSLQGAAFDEALKKIHDVLAKGDVLDIEIIGCNITSNSEKHRSDVSYQLQFPHTWAVGDVVIDTQNGVRTVMGIHFKDIPESFETTNRFSFSGKSVFHYVIFACCVGIPIFIIYALACCIRTRIRRKWLWIIFILFGLTQFEFNWTTGAWDIKPLSILLFGAGYHSVGFYGPWIFNFGFPVGAILFLVYRKKLRLPPKQKVSA